jgi:hypothetical protein
MEGPTNGERKSLTPEGVRLWVRVRVRVEARAMGWRRRVVGRGFLVGRGKAKRNSSLRIVSQLSTEKSKAPASEGGRYKSNSSGAEAHR